MLTLWIRLGGSPRSENEFRACCDRCMHDTRHDDCGMAVIWDALQEAARLRDELTALVDRRIQEATQRTSSEAVTHGVRVRAKSYYIPAHSAPDRQRYFFAYW